MMRKKANDDTQSHSVPKRQTFMTTVEIMNITEVITSLKVNVQWQNKWPVILYCYQIHKHNHKAMHHMSQCTIATHIACSMTLLNFHYKHPTNLLHHWTTPVMPRMITSRMSRRAITPVVMAATLQKVDRLAYSRDLAASRLL